MPNRMLFRNLFSALIISVPILVDCQQPVQWSSIQWNSCIKGSNDNIFGEVKDFELCKHVCLQVQGCKAVVYNGRQGKCITTNVNTNSAVLLRPCNQLGWRYIEIIGSTSAVCQFPFIHKGVTYTACTTKDDPEGKPWCSTQTDNRDNHIIGQFKRCQDSGVGIRTKPTDSGVGIITKPTDSGVGIITKPTECNNDSHCGDNKRCDKTRKCVDPCNSIVCGTNARCHVSNNQPKCLCLANTQGDPRVSCQALQVSVCSDNSHCGSDKRCKSGKCVDACQLAKCGQGATCMMIHGRPQCRCPARMTGDPQKQCFTTQDTLNCKFPFIYKGTQYSECIRAGDPDDKFWCSTKTNNKKNHQKGNWRHCTGCELAKCESGATCQVINANTQSGPHVQCKFNQGTSVCQFPFTYKDNSYSSCTTKDDPDGKLWCSTKIDNQKKHLKGNWKYCPNISGIGDRNINSNLASNSPIGNGPNKPTQGPTRQSGCLSLPDPGECRGAFPRFYYNQQRDQCDCFLFGGCDEERVKFTWLTFEECLGTCVPGNIAKGPGCKRVTLDEVTRFLENEQKNG